MSSFFKNKYKFSLALGVVFLAVTLFAASFAYSAEGFSFLPFTPEEEATEPTEAAPLPEETEPARGEPEEMEELVTFNIPSEMRGTFLVPGVDFLTTNDTTEAAIKKEIDAAFQSAQDLTINAVIIDTAYEDHVIYQTRGAPELSSDFDVMGYIVDRARQEDFYTYAIFDASYYSGKQLAVPLAIGAGNMDKLSDNLEEFAESYGLDGILLDGYQNDGATESYGDYLNLGGGMGFGNFMRQSPAAIVKSASATIREAAPATQVGLLADAVWENQSQNEEGSATEAAFTALSSGNADTKGFIEKGFVDFVAVKAYTTIESATEPFHEVARWWGDVARQNDIPLYVVHAADKIGSGETGWGSQDQILEQVIEASEIGGVRGSIFNRLAPLTSSATTVGDNLEKLYTEEAEPEQVLTQLEMTKPLETTFTTSEPIVTFTGASDPGESLTINNQAIDTDQTGYFSVQMQLAAGLNTFSIRHKDKQIDYAITREIQVLQSAGPTRDVTVEGGMTVTITAVAYAEADVYATVGGETVSMEIDDSVEDEEDRGGSFRTFVGEYRVPAATGEVQTVGGITVYAAYDGEEDSIQGGSVYVNKKSKVEDGVAVRVVADQAITYPPNTSNNIPVATYYPLPRGAMDYAVGDEITYSKSSSETYTYYVLASGLRVESKDIVAITDDYPSGNVISGLTVTADNDYTYATVNTAQQVSYSVKYASTGISFEFHNTTSVPSDMSLSKNPLFSHAGWSGTTLTLSLSTQGSFMGYKGYYDDNGNLVLRFKNPPSSISAARIAIDPGHGGGDQGTAGFLSDYPEKEINYRIASYLADELEGRGASVYLMDNAGIEGPDRKLAAEKWGADLFVSVHTNSAPNTSATGTEVYYFHPFNYRLANAAAAYVSDGLDTNNRGPKQSYYHVSLSSQCVSVLVECGFLSNKSEYEKLVSKSYQKSAAMGIADALSATIKATYTGGAVSGSESTGSSAKPGNQTGGGTGSGSGKPATDLTLRDIEIGVDATETLDLTLYPSGSSADLSWKSDDTRVATVKDGKVTGVREGTAVITVTSRDGLSDRCTVTVSEDAPPSQSGGTTDSGVRLNTVEDAYFDYNEISMNPKSTVRLEILSDAGDVVRGGDFRWESDDTAVATVDKYGYVTAKKTGEATIYAAGGDYDLECDIFVTNAKFEVKGLSFEKTELNMVRKDKITLKPLFSPANASNQKLIWSSSDTNRVFVNQSGVVEAMKAGTATITAKHRESGYSASVTITVTDKAIKVDSIDFYPYRLELEEGETEQLYFTFTPSTAAEPEVTWESDDPDVVSVDQDGNLTANKAGTAFITCTSKDNHRVYGECEIMVVEP